MLTLCPRCATTFRVTPEQLRARKGRVRCGACQEIFNALDTLIEEPPPVVAAPAFEPPQTMAAAVAEPEPTPTAVGFEIAAEPEQPAVLPENVAWAETPVETPPAAAAFDAANEPFHSEPPPVEPVPAEPAAVEPATAEAAAPALATVEEPAPPPAAEEDAAPPNLAERLKAATELEPPPPPRRRRWPWALGTAAALLVLLLQATLRFRTELAVLHPETKPALLALCAALGCQVPLPHRPELLNIETSDLHPDGPGKLLLTASLRNRAPFAQEYPYLELTLTDTGDQPLARRAVAPADYLPKPVAASAGGFGAGGELAINLAVTASDLNAAGYRLYVFYP